MKKACEIFTIIGVLMVVLGVGYATYKIDWLCLFMYIVVLFLVIGVALNNENKVDEEEGKQ